MGANNWAICPRCKQTADAEVARRQEEVDAAYCKVEPDVYREMFADAAKPVELNATLREDYELGINMTGEFYVSYSGRCTKCEFAHKFKHSEQLIEQDDD